MNFLDEFIRSESFGISLDAFLGAFFAFLFVRIATLLDRLFARKAKHRDALVSLERLGNEYLNIIARNEFIIDDYIDIAERNLKNQQGFIYFNELHELHIEKDIIKGLGNRELLNDYFSFLASVESMNGSVAATNRFYRDIKNAYISKQIDQETYFKNIERFIEGVKELKAYLRNLEEGNKYLIAKARILLNDERTFYNRLLGRILKKKLTEEQRNRVHDELQQLNSEIETTRKESREETEKILEEIEAERQK
ncbi:hypothetical protein BRC19_02895 [Candidatus Saccharibacteria bacterium QS_5_54_17]|nr:MAG: hypothetical protein BRC19_02895 [Candidatus Saccharibacteria bacterium QS_5_54_17]